MIVMYYAALIFPHAKFPSLSLGIGFYGPAVVPMLIAYVVTTVETIGDVTATHEVSGEYQVGGSFVAHCHPMFDL